MPLNPPTAAVVNNAADAGDTAHLRAGGQDCIGVRLVNKAGNIPAHIVLTRCTAADTATSVCAQVVGSQAVTDYFNSTIRTGPSTTINNAIPVSSSRGIYEAATP